MDVWEPPVPVDWLYFRIAQVGYERRTHSQIPPLRHLREALHQRLQIVRRPATSMEVLVKLSPAWKRFWDNAKALSKVAKHQRIAGDELKPRLRKPKYLHQRGLQYRPRGLCDPLDRTLIVTEVPRNKSHLPPQDGINSASFFILNQVRKKIQ